MQRERSFANAQSLPFLFFLPLLFISVYNQFLGEIYICN